MDGSASQRGRQKIDSEQTHEWGCFRACEGQEGYGQVVRGGLSGEESFEPGPEGQEVDSHAMHWPPLRESGCQIKSRTHG